MYLKFTIYSIFNVHNIYSKFRIYISGLECTFNPIQARLFLPFKGLRGGL